MYLKNLEKVDQFDHKVQLPLGVTCQHLAYFLYLYQLHF